MTPGPMPGSNPAGWSARRAVLLLIAITTGLRLIWAAVLDVGNDEAYHYLFTVFRDWSYFDHPPMTMWVASIGTSFGGATPFALRLGFVLLFAGSTWILYRWTACWHGESAGFFAAMALNLTAYYTAAAGAFALPDGPLLFFALLTLWALSVALVGRPGQLTPWVWVGLAWGGALLSKYHAAFLPAGAFLYILLTPGTRRVLRTPGPYLAFAIGLLGFLPVLIWNAQNDWASFAFQGNRAVGWRIRPELLLRMLLGQVLYLTPWMWLELVLVLVALTRIARKQAGLERLAVCQSAIPLAFFLVVSSLRDTLPHWSLIAFVPLYPALGARWAGFMAENPKRTRRWLTIWAVVTVSLAVVVAAQSRLGIVRFKPDPTHEMSGWPSVAQELEARGLLDDPNTFLFTSKWYTSGHLAFAIENRLPVLCYNPSEAHGFAYWSRPEDWVGKNGILISLDDWEYETLIYGLFFRRIEPLSEFTMTRNGVPIRTVRVFRCIDQLKPFPFRPKPKSP